MNEVTVTPAGLTPEKTLRTVPSLPPCHRLEDDEALAVLGLVLRSRSSVVIGPHRDGTYESEHLVVLR